MGRIIERDELIGCRLHTILQSYQLLDEWIDFVNNYFVMESGMVFLLPGFSDEPLITTEISGDVFPTRHPLLKQATISPIARLLHPRDEDEWNPDSVWMQTESWLWIGQVTSAPHGTGLAGISIFRDENRDCSDLIDYWAADC